MQPSRKTLGRYELRAVLPGSSGGVVYEGWDSRIARKVAIKTMAVPDAADAELQDRLGRFKREAQAAGRLHHPNIVGIYDYGEIEGLAFIVMEFVDGASLKTLFDRHERFEMPTILQIMGGVLAGLQYSHDRGIVHRDIKPSNIMLTAEGRAKIADFGIARIESSSMTQTGTIMGSPAYMSPEQFLGETVDARTDIYSAGVVLYQMLTGERPYDGGVATIMHKVLHTEAIKPSQISTQSSPMLDAIVTKAMAKRREHRFATAAAFAAELQAAMDSTVIARAPITPRPNRPRPLPPRATPLSPAAKPASSAGHSTARTMAAALAGLAVLGVGGGAAWLVRGSPPAPATPQAASPVSLPSPPPVSQQPDPTPVREAAVPAPAPLPEPQSEPQPEQLAAASLPEEPVPNAPATPPAVSWSPPRPEPPKTVDLPRESGRDAPAAHAALPLPLPPPPPPAFWMPTPLSPEAMPPSSPATRLAARSRLWRSEMAGVNSYPPRSVALASEKPKPWIGLQVRQVSRDDAAALGLGGPTGLLVTGVDGGGPAARAALLPNDVVTAFNGMQLSNIDSLKRAVQAASIGEPASVESWRNGHLRVVSVTVGAEPAQAGHAERRTPPADTAGEPAEALGRVDRADPPQ